jgi:hypothetical protein
MIFNIPTTEDGGMTLVKADEPDEAVLTAAASVPLGVFFET